MDFLRLLAEHRTLPLDALFQFITLFAQETFVVAVICWYYWGRDKNLAYTLGFTYFLSGLTIQGLKVTFRIPRPWVLDPDFSPVKSAVPAATGYSFPSGHTQSGTALFSTLGFSSKKTVTRFLYFSMIVLIGFSRLYLGVHTPKDVLVSMAVTFAISALVWKYGRPLLDSTRYDLTVSLLMILVSCILIIYNFTLYHTGVLPASEAADCFKAGGAGLGFAAGFFVERRWIKFTYPDTFRERLLQFSVGLLTTLAFQQGLKPLLGDSFYGSILRYLIVVFWVIALYPYLFQKIKNSAQRGLRA
ncbi:phosphatase PAP2 family protein [Ruminococcus sp. OA3]|uniref:phosphatase PAP2 family protein n=1 Tax=Ruminococcus sp. OA3 TaxID=2914164 RepID=UPI001F0692F5|nr:phosphatase PAP2 family protein [Ruminococcus sp. OA3]MCH1984268.1 phosphatase PAP2 family protein [Ruminococcus sp. OA3]